MSDFPETASGVQGIRNLYHQIRAMLEQVYFILLIFIILLFRAMTWIRIGVLADLDASMEDVRARQSELQVIFFLNFNLELYFSFHN